MKKKFLSNPSALIITGALLTLLLFLGIVFWLRLLEISLWYLLLLPLVFSLVQFCLTPLLRGMGIFHYYSNFLMANTSDSSVLDLHTGTTFDYVLHFSLRERGLKSKNFIITEILNGLLRIIHEIETGNIDANKKIVAAPYFVSQRTIDKFGFKEKNPALLDRIFLLGSFFDIMLMYAFTQNKFTIPDVWKVKMVEISARQLVAKKDYLWKLKKRF